MIYQDFPNLDNKLISEEKPDNYSTDDDGEFEIDVQPLKKNFKTHEEKKRFIESYTKKKKTELCKNFTMSGFCRFGDSCSFAHGEQELAPKQHLHQKYKTNPCQKYFKDGYCSYGIRCQYIHDEIKDIKNPQFWNFYKILQAESGRQPLVNPKQLQQNQRGDIQRFQKLSKRFPELDIESELFVLGTRLPSFQKITQKKLKNFNSGSASTCSSRKESDEDIRTSQFQF